MVPTGRLTNVKLGDSPTPVFLTPLAVTSQASPSSQPPLSVAAGVTVAVAKQVV